ASAGGATRTVTRRPQSSAPPAPAAAGTPEDAQVLQLAARRGKPPAGGSAGSTSGANASDSGEWEEF
ncbi:hypothetical protein, partial [Pandoraea cepalis]